MNESEDEFDVDESIEGAIDPRLLGTSNAFNVKDSTAGTPKETSSPQKELFAQSHRLTHLSNRQLIVNTLRIHPNLDLRNLFGNMSYSTSTRTNDFPSDPQDAQANNLYIIPTWALMSVNTRPDPGSIRNAFYGMQQEATAILESGKPVIEMHPNIAALFDEDEYNSSGVLSRWAAGMAHSARLKGNAHEICNSLCIVTCTIHSGASLLTFGQATTLPLLQQCTISGG
jgi:hypothetical protein